ncbi:MAG: hypothetical protein ACK476_18210 [Fluviicola sp.]
MRINYYTFLTLSILLFSCNKTSKIDDDCNGNTRREVKILIDDQADEINFTPIFSSIDSLQNIEVIEPDKETARLSVEKQVYTITASVDKVDRKPDGDIHIRLTDGTNYLIAEIPNPNCEYAKNTLWKTTYEDCLAFVNATDLEDKTVKITGVAFIDIDHHYKRKQAKNNLELHPVLSIEF